MAPNRKAVASLVERLSSGDLAGLQDSVAVGQSKPYLPLTDPNAENLLEEKQQQQPPKPESYSYWDWPADTQAEHEAANDDLFSVSHMEANLKKEAAKWLFKNENENTANEDKAAPTSTPSYWDWPPSENDESDTKHAIINRILVEEHARQLVSADRMEAIERRAAAAAKKQGGGSTSSNRSSDEYWGWNYENTKRDWDPSSPDGIQALLKYEEAREFLTADNIVKQLLMWKQPDPSTDIAIRADADKYWAWSQPTVC